MAAKQFPDIQQSGRMPLAREQPMWTAIGEGSLLLGVTGGGHVHSHRRCQVSSWSFRSSSIRDCHLRGRCSVRADSGALSPGGDDHLLLAVNLFKGAAVTGGT